MAVDAPKVRLGRLFEKTSARGNRYFTGRLGAARVLMFASGEAGDDGSPIWDLYVQEVEDKRSETRPARASGEMPSARSVRPPPLQPRQERPFRDDPLDDVLP